MERTTHGGEESIMPKKRNHRPDTKKAMELRWKNDTGDQGNDKINKTDAKTNTDRKKSKQEARGTMKIKTKKDDPDNNDKKQIKRKTTAQPSDNYRRLKIKVEKYCGSFAWTEFSLRFSISILLKREIDGERKVEKITNIETIEEKGVENTTREKAGREMMMMGSWKQS